MPPVAIMGNPAAPAATSATAVGIPHSRNVSPRRAPPSSPLSAARIPSTAANVVPPRPPTSRAPTPAPARSRALCRERPAPVSLAITGTATSPASARRASSVPRARRSPSGCTVSCR